MYTIEGADGRAYGPVDIDQLVEWTRQGRVVPKTAVTDHESSRRFLACDMAELDAVFKHHAALATKPVDATPVLDLRSSTKPPTRFARGRICPRCGSDRVARVRGMDHKSAFACCSCIFAPVMLPLLFLFPGSHSRCHDCGEEW